VLTSTLLYLKGSESACDFGSEIYKLNLKNYLKVGCLHPVACTRSGSGFPSNATLV
jgi:hypothetical protein